VVFAALLIIDDKWDDLVSQAFFHHDQPAQSAVSIFEGVDAFKADMEVKDILQGDVTL
jgi:hypothetical protein